MYLNIVNYFQIYTEKGEIFNFFGIFRLLTQNLINSFFCDGTNTNNKKINNEVQEDLKVVFKLPMRTNPATFSGLTEAMYVETQPPLLEATRMTGPSSAIRSTIARASRIQMSVPALTLTKFLLCLFLKIVICDFSKPKSF
jgi:hypothetical protein